MNPRAARIGVIACAMLIGAGAAAAAQDAASGQDAADFESALFAGSADGAGGTAGGAPDGAQKEDGFSVSAASRETAKTDYLVGGTVSAKASASGVPGDGLTAFSGVSGKLFAKVAVPDYGALFIAYAASYPFFQGVAGEASATAADAADVDYALAELHYSFDIGKAVFIRVGNQLISWGPSRVWTPVDFINREKADSFADVDTRAGKNGLRVHVPLRKANLFLFADFSAMNGDNAYGDIAETVKLAGRADFTFGPFEFGATGYGGRNERARAGADISGRALGTTVYGEAAFAPEYGGYRYEAQASVGFSRALDELKRWTFSAEGFYNSRGSDGTGLTALDWYAIPADERPAYLYEGRWYAYAAISSTRLGSPYVSGTAYAIANLQDRSFAVRLAPRFAFPRAVPFTLQLSYAGGGADKELTRFAGSGAIGLTASVSISF